MNLKMDFSGVIMEKEKLYYYLKKEVVDNAVVVSSNEFYDVDVDFEANVLTFVKVKNGDIILLERCKEKSIYGNTIYTYRNLEKFWSGDYFTSNENFSELVKCLSNKYRELGLTITVVGFVEEMIL